MKPEEFAAALNRMDDKQVKQLAELLGRPSPGQIAEAARAFAKRLDALLPAEVGKLAAAMRTAPASVLDQRTTLPPSLRPGWKRIFRYLPLAAVLLTGAGGGLLAWKTGGLRLAGFWATVGFVAAFCGIMGLVIGLGIKIGRAVTSTPATAGQALPAGAEMIGGGLAGLIWGGLLGALAWLASGVVGITVVGALFGIPMGFLLRYLLVSRHGNALQPAAAERMEAGEWDRALALYERSLRFHAITGTHNAIAVVLNNMGWCLSPWNNPAGDWARAATYYAEAARHRQRARWPDEEGQAGCFMNLGEVFSAKDNPRRDARRAAAAYAQAARLYSACYKRDRQSNALLSVAYCFRPTECPPGNWQVAAAVYEEAGRLAEKAGEKKLHGIALQSQAVSLLQGDAARQTEQSRSLIQRAARLRREAGDEAGAQAAETWLRQPAAAGPRESPAAQPAAAPPDPAEGLAPGIAHESPASRPFTTAPPDEVPRAGEDVPKATRTTQGKEAAEDKEMPAFLAVTCQQCRKPLRVRAALAGKKIKCPHCGHVQPVATP
jgi:hypothetical protein